MKKRAKIISAMLVILAALFIGYAALEASPFIFGKDILRSVQLALTEPNRADEELGWELILVNSENYIPKDYSPELIELSNGQCVDARIYKELQRMFEEAKSDGVYMVVAAGYRTEAKQQSLINERILGYIADGFSYIEAKKLAEKWVAAVGTSEHQLGLAVDINQNPSLCSADEVYDWLYNNAHKYGFIKRYPGDKAEITGISNEPWHYRYVGKKAAEEMRQKNICLEEYVEYLKKEK